MRNYLLEYSEKLAVDIAEMCRTILGENNACFQIKKSSSSIYANIREANYGQSPADMIAKFEIALKEANETVYWFRVLTGLFRENGSIKPLAQEALELRNLLQRIVHSSKK